MFDIFFLYHNSKLRRFSCPNPFNGKLRRVEQSKLFLRPPALEAVFAFASSKIPSVLSCCRITAFRVPKNNSGKTNCTPPGFLLFKKKIPKNRGKMSKYHEHTRCRQTMSGWIENGFKKVMCVGILIVLSVQGKLFLNFIISEFSRLFPAHSVFFGPFLSGSFFPPNDRAQNHAQEKPLLVLFLMTQKCLWTLKVDEVGHKRVVGLEISGDKWGLKKFCPET
jgi:hypothetical protein